MPVKEFFVVTLSSVYRVSSERNEDGGPTIQKIEGSVNGAVKLGGLLPAEENEVVIITRSKEDPDRNKLHALHPDALLLEHQIYLDISTRTSPVVGLFLDREDALDCSEVEDKKIYDERWEDETFLTEFEITRSDDPLFRLFDLDKETA
jgi:hypothetical protein